MTDTFAAAVIDHAAESLANLLGLPCPDDPGNRLRVLALLHDAAHHLIADTVSEARQHGYSTNEIAELTATSEQPS
jgi:hypothetical protein